MTEFPSQPQASYQDHDPSHAARRHGSAIEVGSGVSETGEEFVRLYDLGSKETSDVLVSELQPASESQQEAGAYSETEPLSVENEPKKIGRLKRFLSRGALGKTVDSPYEGPNSDGTPAFTRMTTIDPTGQQEPTTRYIRNE